MKKQHELQQLSAIQVVLGNTKDISEDDKEEPRTSDPLGTSMSRLEKVVSAVPELDELNQQDRKSKSQIHYETIKNFKDNILG